MGVAGQFFEPPACIVPIVQCALFEVNRIDYLPASVSQPATILSGAVALLDQKSGGVVPEFFATSVSLDDV